MSAVIQLVELIGATSTESCRWPRLLPRLKLKPMRTRASMCTVCVVMLTWTSPILAALWIIYEAEWRPRSFPLAPARGDMCWSPSRWFTQKGTSWNLASSRYRAWWVTSTAGPPLRATCEKTLQYKLLVGGFNQPMNEKYAQSSNCIIFLMFGVKTKHKLPPPRIAYRAMY